MLLELKQIYKSYGEKKVLKGIDISASNGQALGLLGRNGAGKTTTIRIITGIFRQDTGEVLVDGKPISKSGVKVGYMPEERGLYPKKNVLEQMVYLGQLKGMSAKTAKKSAHDLLEQLEATEYISNRLDSLSKGNQQKIQLAVSVINDPDIVILDEPFSGLDPVNAAILKRLIEGLVHRDKIVLFSSHQMAYVEEFCRHCCILQGGQIVVNGMIKDIKREYPRDKILVVPDNPAGFEDVVSQMLKANQTVKSMQTVESIQTVQSKQSMRTMQSGHQSEGYICTLYDAEDKDKLMSSLVSNGVGIDRFEVMQPTLEEIFVEKAG